ncbi:MAG: bacteriohemerythrin [Candidatus Korobacteraceae bacterium]
MAQFKWDASYSVHVKQFDADHQQLIDILNQLYDGMTAGHGQAVLNDVLNRLVLYAQRHFAAEEAAMQKVGYPRFQEHLEQHRKFTAKVAEVMQELKKGKIGISLEIFDFVSGWLQNHIRIVDKGYGPALNAKGIA